MAEEIKIKFTGDVSQFNQSVKSVKKEIEGISGGGSGGGSGGFGGGGGIVQGVMRGIGVGAIAGVAASLVSNVTSSLARYSLLGNRNLDKDVKSSFISGIGDIFSSWFSYGGAGAGVGMGVGAFLGGPAGAGVGGAIGFGVGSMAGTVKGFIDAVLGTKEALVAFEQKLAMGNVSLASVQRIRAGELDTELGVEAGTHARAMEHSASMIAMSPEALPNFLESRGLGNLAGMVRGASASEQAGLFTEFITNGDLSAKDIQDGMKRGYINEAGFTVAQQAGVVSKGQTYNEAYLNQIKPGENSREELSGMAQNVEKIARTIGEANQ